MLASISQAYISAPEGDALAELMRDLRRHKDVVALSNDLAFAFPARGDGNAWLEAMARVKKHGFFRAYSNSLKKTERKVGLSAYYREFLSAKFFTSFGTFTTYYDPRDCRANATRVRIKSQWIMKTETDAPVFNHEVELVRGLEHESDWASQTLLSEQASPNRLMSDRIVLSLLDRHLSRHSLDLHPQTMSQRWAAACLRRAGFGIEPRPAGDSEGDAWVCQSPDGQLRLELRGTDSWPRTTVIELNAPVTLKAYWFDARGAEVDFKRGVFPLREAMAKAAQVVTH